TGGVVSGSLGGAFAGAGDVGATLAASAGEVWRAGGAAWLLLALLGCVLAIRSGRPELALHVQYVLAIAVALLVSPIGHAAVIVVLPGLCLLAAVAMVEMVDEALRAPRYRMPALVAVTMLVAAKPALETWHLIRRDGATDTRVMAARWVEENVPLHTGIVVPRDPQVVWQSTIPVWDLKRSMKRAQPWVEREDRASAAHWEAGIRSRGLTRYDLHFADAPDADGGEAESTGSAPDYAVVAATDTMWRGEVIVAFAPDGIDTKGPALEVRHLDNGDGPVSDDETP
ncbi:hypothetical protein K8I85_10815, partial [bacterium]|nr:hypothetical protein [bacterium]